MKFTPGILIGSASGSVGGTTVSRNHYGLYARTRATPTNPNTDYQQNVRSLLSTYSSAWQGLTDAQRIAWATWAQGHPVVDSLGQSQILTPHTAYIQLNTRLALAEEAAIDVPPIGTAPNGLTTLVLSADQGAGTFDLTFTATPLAATERLWVRGALVASAGINYVENLLKLLVVSAAAQASPLDIEAETIVRFGSLADGQKLVVLASVFDNATGLLSVPRRSEAIVETTV